MKKSIDMNSLTNLKYFSKFSANKYQIKLEMFLQVFRKKKYLKSERMKMILVYIYEGKIDIA